MKQFVIDRMKEYQHKKENIKAVKYREGMEDAWMVEYTEYIEDSDGTSNNRVDKLFWTKESAEEYMKYEHSEDNYKDLFCAYTEVIPVLLREISEDEYEDDCFTITQDGQYFEYEELDEYDWIILDSKGNIRVECDFEKKYELNNPDDILSSKPIAKIGYDEKLRELFIEFNGNYITNIDANEIATVEKILDGLQIPFIERIGAYF